MTRMLRMPRSWQLPFFSCFGKSILHMRDSPAIGWKNQPARYSRGEYNSRGKRRIKLTTSQEPEGSTMEIPISGVSHPCSSSPSVGQALALVLSTVESRHSISGKMSWPCRDIETLDYLAHDHFDRPHKPVRGLHSPVHITSGVDSRASPRSTWA